MRFATQAVLKTIVKESLDQNAALITAISATRSNLARSAARGWETNDDRRESQRSRERQRRDSVTPEQRVEKKPQNVHIGENRASAGTDAQ